MSSLIHRDPAELSRPVDVGDLDDGEETTETVVVDDAERRALATRFGLVELTSLEAAVTLRREGPDVAARGHLKADVVQSCVVTLDPVEGHVAEDFTQRYSPDAGDPDDEEMVFDLDDEEPAQPLSGDRLDIGPLVAEILGLGLEPYPRKPGAEVDERWRAPEAAPEDDEANPFAALKKLKT